MAVIPKRGTPPSSRPTTPPPPPSDSGLAVGLPLIVPSRITEMQYAVAQLVLKGEVGHMTKGQARLIVRLYKKQLYYRGESLRKMQRDNGEGYIDVGPHRPPPER